MAALRNSRVIADAATSAYRHSADAALGNAMHHLLAVLSLATALVAPTRRQTTRLRAASLEKKGDDYIFDDIAKNLGKATRTACTSTRSSSRNATARTRSAARRRRRSPRSPSRASLLSSRP